MLGGKRNIYPSHSMADALFRAVDAGCVLLALYVSCSSTIPLKSEWFWLVGTVAIVVFYMTGTFCGMYRNWRGASVEREIMCGLISWSFTCISLLLIGYTTSLLHSFSRATTMIWFFSAALLIVGSRVIIRAVLRSLRAHGLNSRRYAIAGINDLAFQLARNIDATPQLGLSLLGFYDDRPAQRTPDVPQEIGARCIGNLDQLVEASRNGDVDMIYITFPMRAEDRIRNVLNRLADSTVSVYIVPDFFVFELLHSRWTNINGLPAVSIFEHPFYGVDGMVKRALDVVLASVALTLLAIPMLIVAAGIKLSSSGPIFFRQRRYGLDGREIHVWKFRTMRVCEDGDRITQARHNDDRVTRLGAVLRRTSLDELPQLLNVIEGSMSLVGPRPHATAHNEHYRTLIQGYMLRHKVKPGITGMAQVNGCRGETDTLDKMRRRIEYDHRYIREWSTWLDFKILFQTIRVVLTRTNAY